MASLKMITALIRWTCIGLLLALVTAQKTRYDGYWVVEVPSASRDQLATVEAAGLDVWRVAQAADGAPAVAFDVMIDSNGSALLQALQLSSSIKIADVQELIDEEEAAIHAGVGASWYDSYHTYEDIVQRLQELARNFPQIAKFVPSIGQSVQGRAIPALVISSGSRNITKHVYLEAGQHAREWVAPHTLMYIAEQLVTLHSSDEDVAALLDRVTFDVVPMVNPDGYSFSWSNTRLWRKNRRLNTGGSYGVDLNRNWNDHWCLTGASKTPSSDTYCGTGPFSEPETKAASNYVLQSPYAFDAAIDFHSYGQLVLRPPGYASTPLPDEALTRAVGNAMRAAILAVHSVPYTSEMSWELYVASGSADDWWYNSAKIKLAYTIELRDTGRYGFTLPAAQIVSTGEENFAAIKYLAGYLINS